MIKNLVSDLEKLNAVLDGPDVTKILDALPSINDGNPMKDFIDDDEVFDTLIILLKILKPDATTKCPACGGDGYFWGPNEDTRCTECNRGQISVYGNEE